MIDLFEAKGLIVYVQETEWSVSSVTSFSKDLCFILLLILISFHKLIKNTPGNSS